MSISTLLHSAPYLEYGIMVLSKSSADIRNYKYDPGNVLKLIPATLALSIGSALWIAEKAIHFILYKQDHLFPSKVILHIPTIEEMRSQPLDKIQAVWRRNNEILLGLIQTNPIPKFGLHGTSRLGMEGIQNSKNSRGEYFFIASYDYQLDPITFLADLYSIAAKASAYSRENGGIFTLLANDRKTLPVNKFISSNSLGFLPQDSNSDNTFLNLVGRQQNCRYARKVLSGWFDRDRGNNDHILNSQTILSTQDLLIANEYTRPFNPDTYDEVVKGVLAVNDLIFTEPVLNDFYEQTDLSMCKEDKALQAERYRRFVLGKRFRLQEIVIDAFKKLEVIKTSNSTHSWQELKVIGEDLMKSIDQVTQISVEKLLQIYPKALSSATCYE